MKISTWLLIIILVVGLPVALNSWSAFEKNNFELEKECAIKVREYFKGDPYVFMEGGLRSVKGHYNHKLNTCFVNTHSSAYLTGVDSKKILDVYDSLDDAIEGRSYASIHEQNGRFESCDIRGKDCHAKAEYENYVKECMGGNQGREYIKLFGKGESEDSDR